MTFYEGKSQKVGFRLLGECGCCTMYVLDSHNKGQIYKTTVHNISAALTETKTRTIRNEANKKETTFDLVQEGKTSCFRQDP